MPDLKLVPVDHNPFEVWGNVGAAMPESYGANSPVMDPLAKLALSAGSALMIPGQAYGSREPVTTEQMVGPAFDLAGMTTLGAGAIPAEANAMRMGIKAYHGSPHDFDKFMMDKIGTGEGAQAYGHGLYFAENEGVAKSYRDALAGSTVDGQPFNPANPLHQAAARIDEQGNRAAAMDEVERRIAADPGDDMHPRTLAMLLHRPEIPPIRPASGKMYEVNINADPEHFLDWDKPLSEQHPKVQEALGGDVSQLGSDAYRAASTNAALENAKISDPPVWYRDKGDPQISQHLRQAGIPGIKYLDQGSRGKGEGSRNYVVFDDSLINIVRKYGLAGLSMLPPATAAYLSQKIAPVDHDPFSSGAALTPVDHDPFEQRS